MSQPMSQEELAKRIEKAHAFIAHFKGGWSTHVHARMNSEELCNELDAVLSALRSAPAKFKVEPNGPPCPTCGFSITRKVREPFFIEDDSPAPAMEEHRENPHSDEGYRIQFWGECARVEHVSGWAAVVAAIANDMFSDPTPDDVLEVATMLVHGVDGSPGWDGKSVHCQFEDGSFEVTPALVSSPSTDIEPLTPEWARAQAKLETAMDTELRGKALPSSEMREKVREWLKKCAAHKTMMDSGAADAEHVAKVLCAESASILRDLSPAILNAAANAESLKEAVKLLERIDLHKVLGSPAFQIEKAQNDIDAFLSRPDIQKLAGNTQGVSQ